jgi:hypothetical protein
MLLAITMFSVTEEFSTDDMDSTFSLIESTEETITCKLNTVLVSE